MNETTARTPETRKPDTITSCQCFTHTDMGSQKPRPPTQCPDPPKHPRAPAPNSPTIQARNTSNSSCWLSGDYSTNYPVTLSGVAEATAGQLLHVNRSKISLNPSEYLIMLILICHSLQMAGKPAPVKVPLFPFLSAADVAYAMAEYCKKAKTTSFSRQWDAFSVSRLVYTIRIKLKKRGLNKWLVQNDDRGRGLRLGTQPGNVSLIYLDPDTQQVIKIDGADPGNSSRRRSRN